MLHRSSASANAGVNQQRCARRTHRPSATTPAQLLDGADSQVVDIPKKIQRLKLAGKPQLHGRELLRKLVGKVLHQPRLGKGLFERADQPKLLGDLAAARV